MSPRLNSDPSNWNEYGIMLIASSSEKGSVSTRDEVPAG